MLPMLVRAELVHTEILARMSRNNEYTQESSDWLREILSEAATILAENLQLDEKTDFIHFDDLYGYVEATKQFSGVNYNRELYDFDSDENQAFSLLLEDRLVLPFYLDYVYKDDVNVLTVGDTISGHFRASAKMLMDKGNFLVKSGNIYGIYDQGAKKHYKECGFAWVGKIKELTASEFCDTYTGNNEYQGIQAYTECKCGLYTSNCRIDGEFGDIAQNLLGNPEYMAD